MDLLPLISFNEKLFEEHNFELLICKTDSGLLQAEQIAAAELPFQSALNLNDQQKQFRQRSVCDKTGAIHDPPKDVIRLSGMV